MSPDSIARGRVLAKQAKDVKGNKLRFSPLPCTIVGMDKPDVLIVGAGVIGGSLAWELARAGVSVTIVDRGAVGCGASSAAAGLLSPTMGQRRPWVRSPT